MIIGFSKNRVKPYVREDVHRHSLFHQFLVLKQKTEQVNNEDFVWNKIKTSCIPV
jgi:hypothetical protein